MTGAKWSHSWWFFGRRGHSPYGQPSEEFALQFDKAFLRCLWRGIPRRHSPLRTHFALKSPFLKNVIYCCKHFPTPSITVWRPLCSMYLGNLIPYNTHRYQDIMHHCSTVFRITCILTINSLPYFYVVICFQIMEMGKYYSILYRVCSLPNVW